MKSSFLKNTFFTKEQYGHRDSLTIDENMLDAMIVAHASLPRAVTIEFFFLTDTRKKASLLANYLDADQSPGLKITTSLTNDCWQIRGCTHKAELTVEEINRLIMQMWDAGYTHDCFLEGWQVIE